MAGRPCVILSAAPLWRPARFNYFINMEEVFEALTQESGEITAFCPPRARRLIILSNLSTASYLTYFSYYAENLETYHLVRSNRGRDGGNINMRGPQDGRFGRNAARY